MASDKPKGRPRIENPTPKQIKRRERYDSPQQVAKRKRNSDEIYKDLKSRSSVRGREIRDADLRLRLDGQRTIDRINVIGDEFTLLDQQIKDARNTKKNPNRIKNRIEKNTARAKILKTQADIMFNKLHKILPDIKSIEQSVVLKPGKIENMPEDKLVEILTDSVSMEELTNMFPQYNDLMKELESMDLPELMN